MKFCWFLSSKNMQERKSKVAYAYKPLTVKYIRLLNSGKVSDYCRDDYNISQEIVSLLT